ncbi:MAG: sugar nucleotide-binding protein [Chloroflexota bacterium]
MGGSGYLGRQIYALLESTHSVIKTHFSGSPLGKSIQYNFFEDNIQSTVDLDQIDVVIFASAVEFQATEQVQPSMEKFAQALKDKRLIYLSSDGIFDGERGSYAETDQPKPKTLYGRNLASCEDILSTICKNLCIIRPSYIYGFSCGRLDQRLAQTKSKLEAGETVERFDDMFKSPLGVEQVAQAVIDVANLDYSGILHVSGKRLSVFDFHFQAMEALGVNVSNMERTQMPKTGEFLPDTSLKSSLWQNLTGANPKSIFATLQNSD